MRRIVEFLRRTLARLLAPRDRPCSVCGRPTPTPRFAYPVCPACRPGWERERVTW